MIGGRSIVRGVALLLALALAPWAPSRAQITVLYEDDFQQAAPGGDLPAWLDSLYENPEEIADFLFGVHADPLDPANVVFGHVRDDSIGLSHYTGVVFSPSEGFRLDGRMYRSHPGGHIGLTLFSGLPGTHDHYLIGQTTPDGTVAAYACGGVESGAGTPYPACSRGPLAGALDSGVHMTFASWFRFRLETFRETGGLRILFKIWPDDTSEPAGWQVDALDPASSFDSGQLGLWATGWGNQFWDDLHVQHAPVAPAITILEAGAPLLTGGLYNRDVVPEIEVADASPVAVSILLDGQAFSSGTPVPTEGEHQLEVEATDIYGNSSSAARAFEIDKTPPVFVSVTPPDGTLTGDAQIGLQGVVEGAEELFINGAPVPLQGTDFSISTLGLVEGATTLLLRAVDRAGNVTELLHHLELDTTPPSVSIAQPAGGITGTGEVTVSGTAQDLHLSEVRVNGTPATLNGNQYSASSVALAEGDNTLTVEAVDAVGNTGSATRAITLDSIPPVIEITDGGAPLPDGLLTNQTVVPVIAASDATAVQVSAQLGGGGFVSGTPVASDGVYQLNVTATDAAGNVSTAARAFEVDKTPPVFQSVSPPSGTLTGEVEVELTGVVVGATTMTVAGQPGTLVGENFTGAPTALAEGSNTIALTATDAAGNSTAIDHLIELDTLAPEILILEPVDLTILATTPTRVTGSVRDAHLDGVTVNGVAAVVTGESFVIENLSLAEGANLLTAVATDVLGHSAADDAAVTLDTIPPVIEILEGGVPLEDGTLFNRAVQTSIQVEDATSADVSPLLDGSPFATEGTVGTEGPHELRVTAVDAAGNSSSAVVTFTVDTLPPVFVEILPQEGSLTAAGEVNLTGVVLDAVEVTIDGVPVTLSGEDFVSGLLALVEGETEFALEAVDAAGNRAQTAHVLIRDSTPPVVNIVDPGEGALLGTVSVGISGPVFDLHLDSVEVNGIEAEVSGDTYLALAVPLAEGDNQIIAVARDGAGNVGTATIGVVLDTLPPDVLIVDPADATTTAADQIILVGTADDPHLDRVEVNGAPTQLTGNQWTVSVPLAEGINDFEVVAFDRLGHTGNDDVMVLRDGTAPAIEIVTPSEGERLNVAITDVTGTVEAADGTTVTVNGLAAEVTGGDFLAVDVPLVEGENRLIARARDALANEGVNSRLVFVDTVPPELVSSNPVTGALAISPATRFRLVFSEPLGPLEAGDMVLEPVGGSPLAVSLNLLGDEADVAPLSELPSATDLDLAVTDAIQDLAGNPLANPQVLRFTTVDAAAPPPPFVDPISPFVCASALTLTGTSQPEAIIVVDGGAASVEADVASDGGFELAVPLEPDRLNVLSVAARDRSGNRSVSVSVQTFHDCRGPVVIAARREGDIFTATFNEPIDPATATLPGAVTLTSESGGVPGSVVVDTGAVEAAFSATEALSAGVYRFAASQQILDRAANPLAYPFAKRFGANVAAGTAFLTGTVLDDASGRPLAGALVSVVATGGVVLAEPLPEQVTGSDGRFSIPVEAGTHEISVTRTGYSSVVRIAAAQSDEGRDLLDPRLTPLASGEEVDASGETITTSDGIRLLVPPGALSGPAEVVATLLDEQGLPALLPFGWSPRGAVWIQTDDLAGLGSSTLAMPVEAPNGTVLPIAELDFATLQWRVLGLVSVLDGRVEIQIPGDGAYAAVAADGAPTAPPVPVQGQVLGSSGAVGREVVSASVDFSPQVVLPAQSSRATVNYTLGANVPSGVPLTLTIREELSLLAGGTRVERPYTADLVIYRDPTGAPRSRFRLRPSEAARLLPIEIGHEDVSLASYDGETVRGNVLGPAGGSVTSIEGDQADLPAGAVDEPTAVVLRRGDAAHLVPPPPLGGTVLGVLELDAGGNALLAPVSLSLQQSPAPAPGSRALILELYLHEGAPIYRPVAEAEATAAGWSSVPVDPVDLPWPRLTGEGVFVFFEPASAVGFFRGSVFGVSAAPASGAVVSSAGIEWIQIAGPDGSYVFPAPVTASGETTVLAADCPATGNRGTAAGVIPALSARVDLDILLLAVGPEVVAITPGDGAIGVPAGVQPTVRFSEPVDPVSLELGVHLLANGSPVDITRQVDGALVTLVPDVTLLPGETYEIQVETSVRDLLGFPLAAPVSATFETLLVLFNKNIDLTKIFLIEPDATGFARIVGEPGAVPHRTLVFVENLDALVSTPSVEADQDGDFELMIEANVSHRILMHVLVVGSNELVLELTPFRTEDLKGGYVTGRPIEFTTIDDFTVMVDEGSFAEPTLIRVEPETLETAGVPMPSSFGSLLGFSLELEGGRALKGLRISVPAPDGLTGGPFYLAAPVATFHGRKWMIDDVAQLVNGRLTTEIDPDVDDGSSGPGSGTRGQSGGGGPRTGTRTDEADEPSETGPPPKVPRHMLPGMWSPKKRNYQFWDASEQLAWVSLPVISGSVMFLPGMDLALSLTSLTTPLLRGVVAIPTRLEDAFDVEVRDLTTGYILFDETFGPPTDDGEIIELPVDPDANDSEPPVPVAASPIQLFTLELGRRQSSVIGSGIEVEVTGGGSSSTITITGSPDAAQGDVKLRLLNLDTGAAEFTTSQGDGSFTLTMGGKEGERLILAIGARVGTSQVFDLEFNEALDEDLTGIDVSGPSGRTVDPIVTAVGTRQRVRITPRTGWVAGKTYKITLAENLTDAAGNEWGQDLEIEFNIDEAKKLSTYTTFDANGIARVGRYLIVTSIAEGIIVLDAGDPNVIHHAVSGGISLPFRDGARGLAADPHGRVMVVAGGLFSPGQLAIFDPFDFDPADIAANAGESITRYKAINGVTRISSAPAGAINLPVGTPQRVAILSNDERSEWRVGIDPAPDGVTVTGTPPAGGGDYTVTVSGADGSDGLPVTLRDRDLGRWHRVDSSGTSYSIELKVRNGSRLELLRNRQTVAYVAVAKAGIAVVDVNGFYNSEDTTTSHVLGYFTGAADPELVICRDAPKGLEIVTQIKVLDDAEATHPLTIPTVIFREGLLMMSAPPTQPAAIQPIAKTCPIIGDFPGGVIGLEVLKNFPIDANGDGEVSAAEETRDYLLLGHVNGVVMIYDVTARSSPQLVSQVDIGGTISHLVADTVRRRLYVSGFSGGLHVVGLGGKLSKGKIDGDGDGKDDRILETVAIGGITKSPILVAPELGIVYAGGRQRGVTAVAIDKPLVTALGRDATGGLRPIASLAPFGVPTAPAPGSESEDDPDLPGSFFILATLPGWSSDTLEVDVASLGPLGAKLAEVGDPDQVAELPRRNLTDDHAVELRRLSNKPTDEGYHMFLSEEIAVVADLRAARGYTRSTEEDDRCERCDQEEEGTGADALELLSGETVKLRFPQTVRTTMESVYRRDRLRAAEFALRSVPWDSSPAVRQEPLQNASYGTGEVAPGTLLHSGEFSQAVTDLTIRGRGFDFAFTRTYRSQAVSDGPLGPGWDHSYRQRLREIPNGDVEYRDGRGRVEIFEKNEDDSGDGSGGPTFDPPPGRFAELRRTADGWLLLDARRNIASFDRFGRLVSLADHVKESEDTGNLMTFHYNAASLLERVTDTLDRDVYFEYDDEGRLTRIEDFDGRDVLYEYDTHGRLEKVASPDISTGSGPFGRLETRCEYENPVTGSVAEYLNSRDNNTEYRDARGERWLTVDYTDADGDGIANEATSQSWGGRSLSIGYNFTSRQASVTDRRGNTWTTQHEEEGQSMSRTDPSGATFTYTYDDEGLLETGTLPLGRMTRYTYDTATGARSRGNATSIEVTADGRGENGSSSVLSTTIDYDLATNQPVAITDPRGASTSIGRRPNGLALTVSRPEAATNTTEFNEFGQPLVRTNPNGNRVTYTYFESGPSTGYLRRMVVDPDGLALTTRYETDARGNVTATIDPRGVRHETDYNEVDWSVTSRAAVTGAADGTGAGPLGYRTSYVYDQNGNVVTEKLPFGPTGSGVTENRTTYGVLNEVLTNVREVGTGGGAVTETRTYDDNFNVDTITHPEGNVTKYDYDPRNLVQTSTRGFGSTAFESETYSYSADRDRTASTNGRSQTWTTEYDGFGRPMKATDPLGNHSMTEYDNNANPVMTRNFDASETLLSAGGGEFDLLNRRTASTETLFNAGEPGTNGALRSTTTYDPASNVRASTDSLGRTTQFVYDQAERMMETVDPVGNRTVSTLDANGNAIHSESIEVVPGGGTVNVPIDATFDALGRRLTATDALGNTSRSAYDARSNVIRTVDPEGFLTTSAYDGLDRMVKTTPTEGISVDYAYDANSRLRTYTDALGNRTTYTYDAADRQKTVSYPDSTSEAFEYDPAGNVVAITDANGSQITQVHDASNRIIERTVAPGSGVVGVVNETYAYDGLDRVTQAVSGGAATAFTYDSLSRMTSESTAVGGGGAKTVAYCHDLVGNATRITYPSGHQVSTNFDPLDRPGIVSGGGTAAVSYGYRGPDLIKAKQYGNGIQGEMTFDAAKRPVSHDYMRGGGSGVPGSLAFSEQLAWSPRGLKVETTRADLGGRGLLIGYDGAGRVTEAARVASPSAGNNSAPPVSIDTEAGGFGYAYDRAENLLFETQVSQAGTRDISLPLDGSGRNRPGAIAGLPLAYDSNGNMTQRGHQTFQYDYRNRIARVTNGAGAEVASYTYDAFNRRIAKTVGGGGPSATTEETVWGGWLNLEQYVPASGGAGGQQLASRRTYGAGLDEIVRLESDVDGNGTLETSVTPLYDSTGNLVLATGPDGRTLERYEYSPYGERTIFASFFGPQAEQIRAVSGLLWVELTQPALPAPLQAAVSDGTLTLVVSGTEVPITVTQPVTSGRQARRRLVIEAGAIPAGSPVSLMLPALGLVDEFGNLPPGNAVHDFTWPADDSVLIDTTKARLAYVSLDGRQLEIQLSEEADLSAAATTITLDGTPTSWTLDADRYTISGTAGLSTGSHILDFSAGPLDLTGKGLAEAFTVAFEVSSSPDGCPPLTICGTSSKGGILHEVPESSEVAISTVGNSYGFHGRPVDPETGLVYIRNRYYDPVTARFVSTDSMGYRDGPSLYQYGWNDPFNRTDPTGREVYLIYREFNIDGLRERYPKIGHVYLAFDSKGLENPARWRSLVVELGKQDEPPRNPNPGAETFSFHPWGVRDVGGVHDKSNDLLYTVCTMGSFVGYNDEYDQKTVQGIAGGSLQAMTVSLGVTQNVQERLYRAAIASRNLNNKSPISGDIGTYKLGTNNCGTWARNILESNRVAWPQEAKKFNQGIGTGGKWDKNPGTGGVIEGLTKGVCIGGLAVRQIGRAAEACGGSWEAGMPGFEPTPPTPPETPPVCTRSGCVDPVTQRPLG